MATCGLWPTKRGIVAVVAGDDGVAAGSARTAACTPEACWALLAHIEAHHLRSDVLEELRLLTNYDMDSQNRLCLIFVGHPELRRRVSMAVHEALNQRIIVRHHLGGLLRDELPLYLAHLLRRAGTELPLFEPAAIEAIYQASAGLPRKANSFAHHALNAAAIARAKVVTAEHVQAAAPEVG